MAENNFFSKNVCRGHKNILKYMILDETKIYFECAASYGRTAARPCRQNAFLVTPLFPWYASFFLPLLISVFLYFLGMVFLNVGSKKVELCII